MLNIRALEEKDLVQIEKIYSQVFDSKYISYSEIHLGFATTLTEISPQAGDIFHQELLDIMKDENAEAFVVIVRNVIVGFVIVRLKLGSNGMWECWLEDMINLDHDLAIPNALYAEVCRWAKEKHCKYIFFESNHKNKRLHTAAQRYGFQPLCIIFAKPVD